MKKLYLITILTIGAVCGLAYFVYLNLPTTPSVTKLDDSEATQEGIEKIVEANNKFAFDFYSTLKEEETGNIFFSPYSISTALSMIYEGADGETAKEIAEVFNLPPETVLRRSAIAAVYNQLNSKNTEYKLETANGLWVQEKYPLLDSYTNIINQYYGAKAQNADFVNSAGKMVNEINSWVEGKTNNKIKDLFSPGSINQNTRLVLANAIYFKGDWVQQFDKKKTQKEEFNITDSESVKVDMMRRTGEDSKYYYTEDDAVQVLEMDYKGEDLSMLVLLPKGHNIEQLEELIGVEQIQNWREALRKQSVNVYMPKFTFESKYTLNNYLKEMGMATAFVSGKADLSKMDGTRNLFIQHAVHQAFVDVNEEGTEAAAATGVSVGITSVAPPAKVFRADRPFMFIIQQKDTANILFIGRFTNPNSQV